MVEFRELKGIGKKTEELLNKLNLYNLNDLIMHYPFRYDVIRKTSLESEKVVVSGIIESNPIISYFNKMNKLAFKFNINNMLVTVNVFNRGFLKNSLSIGKIITIIGKYDKKRNILIASDIKLEDIGSNIKIEPVYHLVKGITNKNILKFINLALDNVDIIDYIPLSIVEKYNFMDKKSALKFIHNPVDENKLKEALIRCKYEELFLFMLKINALKIKNSELNIGYKKSIDREKINKFICNIPFELTKDQLIVLDEIFNDLQSNKRMNRLVEGDVGSGKTIVSIISMYVLYLNGYQSALMSPTEILAKQHYNNMVKLFGKYNVNISILLGSTPKKEKEKILGNLENGNIDIVIGTHSLVQDNVIFKNLGLVVTDEQHRFGVNQRNNLRNKGNMPDVLYMSATPIPRTYALTIYGDMDISIIKSMPSGRKKIITEIIESDNIRKVLLMIKRELDLGHQIYIVSPLIENSDSEDEDTIKLYKKFSMAFKNYNIGILHGKMGTEEKDNIMNEFLDGNINILISTTVIEVGVDVKNATMIVIFDAYKFGLATLHQLRGRVGRNSVQSYCILVTNRDSKRLEIMKSTSDGFRLAEEDLKLRGHGDLFGIKQSGDMTFKLANISRDYKILMKAKEDSMNILNDIDNYATLKDMLKQTINMD